jgi:quercetin dioxygenase-like cupin family protein
MDVIHFKTAENYEPEMNWKRTSLCNQKDISVEHFIKPAGHASPRHAHTNGQVLFILQGKLVIITDKDEQLLEVGDAVYIPGNEEHVVKNPLQEISVGVDIFVPGRSFDFWLKKRQIRDHP